MRTRTGRSFEQIDRNHSQVANADFLSPGWFFESPTILLRTLSSLLFVNSYVCYFAIEPNAYRQKCGIWIAKIGKS